MMEDRVEEGRTYLVNKSCGLRYQISDTTFQNSFHRCAKCRINTSG